MQRNRTEQYSVRALAAGTGISKSQAVEPLFPSAAKAAQSDNVLYALLALIDAIRLGQPRERKLAIKILEKQLGLIDG